MRRALFLAAALIAGGPALAAAQSAGAVPGSAVVAVGVASGSAWFTCGSCAGRDPGLSFFAHAGAAVRPDLDLGAELTWWSTKFEHDPRGDGEARVVFANAVARWRPKASLGLFVKGGGGLSWVRDRVDLAGAASTLVVETTNPSLVVGAGWDVPVTGRWSVTPWADLNAALKADQDVNGTPTIDRLGSTVLHFGVAVTLK